MLEEIVDRKLVPTVLIDSELSADEILWAKRRLRQMVLDSLRSWMFGALDRALGRGIPKADAERLFDDRLFKELSLISLAGYLLLDGYNRLTIVRGAVWLTIAFE
jgi:hypothetical protein